MAPENTDFSFATPVEGEALLLPTLERLRTLYTGAYARGATFTTTLVPEGEYLELGKCTFTGAAGYELFPGGGDPYPIRASEQWSKLGAHYDL